MYVYTICTTPDAALFLKQCTALERHIPDLKKGQLLTDVNGSQTQLYTCAEYRISVHNSYYLNGLCVKSEIDLLPFFNH